MDNSKVVETNKFTDKQKVIFYFFVYSFLGWILETIYCLVTLGIFNKRGFLYGPICPIYGFSAVILIVCLRKIKTNTIGKFFISMIAFTIVEYVASAVLEDLFKLRWWDYSDQVFNFQGRISLAFSLVWGILGVIFVEKVHPFIKRNIEKLIIKVPNKIKITILYSSVIIVIIDYIFSVIKYVNI